MTTPLSELKDKRARTALPDLCREYRSQSELESNAKAVKRVLMSEIAQHAKRAKVDKVQGDGWLLMSSKTTRRSISPEKLLEKGVEMGVIEFATETRETSYYQVRGVKDAV